MKLNQNYILGVAGRAGAGKTTFANLLKTELFREGLIDSPIIIIGLADYLKKAVTDLYGISLDKLNESKQHPLGRFILEQVGQNFFPFGFHVDQLDKHLKTLQSNFVIIHDVRMQHEVDYIHQQKGIVVRVYRPGEVENRQPHPTEVGINKLTCDQYLHNDHGTQHLQFLARDLAKQLVCIYLRHLLISKTENTPKSV